MHDIEPYQDLRIYILKNRLWGISGKAYVSNHVSIGCYTFSPTKAKETHLISNSYLSMNKKGTFTRN